MYGLLFFSIRNLPRFKKTNAFLLKQTLGWQSLLLRPVRLGSALWNLNISRRYLKGTVQRKLRGVESDTNR
jgi:hypothetical protein